MLFVGLGHLQSALVDFLLGWIVEQFVGFALFVKRLLQLLGGDLVASRRRKKPRRLKNRGAFMAIHSAAKQ